MANPPRDAGFCCVPGCDSIQSTSGYSFHDFPHNPSLRIVQYRRKLWSDAVFGEDSTRKIKRYTKICGKHFETGKPASLHETYERNWIPTLHLGEGRVIPDVKLNSGMAFTEERMPVTETVIFEEQKVVQMVRSEESDPFEGEDMTVKVELLDEVEEERQDEAEQLLSEPQTDEIFFKDGVRCMFCLNELSRNEKVLLDFNKENTFRTQVEYVLAKTVESPSYPCCKNCNRMFELFYEFKKSCLLALARPQELINSSNRKRPADSQQGPAPKRRSKVVTIHPKIDKPSKIQSFSSDSEDHSEEPPSDLYLEERLRCKNCGNVYKDGFELEDHKLKCLPPVERPKCHLCPAVLRNNWELQVHLNRHNGLTPFPCRSPGCLKSFPGPVLRIVHEKKCQKESNKVVCPVCGMSFKCTSYLQRHSRIHDAPKYECDVCHRKFTDLTTYRGHMMRHFERNETPKEPEDADVQLVYQCDSCDQACASRELLNGHKVYCKKNEKFRKFQLLCPRCPESFNKQKTLDQHLNRHKGIKSVPCRKEGCDKMFFDIPGRNVHELYRCGNEAAEGTKHDCSVCQAKFITPAALRVHMRGHKKATAVKS